MTTKLKNLKILCGLQVESSQDETKEEEIDQENEHENHNGSSGSGSNTVGRNDDVSSPRGQVARALTNVDTNAPPLRSSKYSKVGPAKSEAAAAKVRRDSQKGIASTIATQNVRRGRGNSVPQSGIVMIDTCQNKDAPAEGGQNKTRTQEQIDGEVRMTLQAPSWPHVYATSKALGRIVKYHRSKGSCPVTVTNLVGLGPAETDRIYDEQARQRSDDRSRKMTQVAADIPQPPSGTLTVSNSHFANMGGAVQQ